MRNKKDIVFDLSHHELQVMPKSESLERDVLGALLDIPDLAPMAIKYLSPKGMFSHPDNAKVWKEVMNLHRGSKSISHATVIQQFELLRDKEGINYVNYLKSCGDAPIRFENNCLKLNEYWIKRTLFQYGYYINQQAFKPENDALDTLGQASDVLGKIFLHIAKMKETTMQDAVSDLASEIHRIVESKNGLIGLPSSLSEINRVARGYRKGNLIIIAASTSEGKTTLAIQETRFSIENGVGVGYISCEMSTAELLLIMACSACGLDTRRILSNQATAQDVDKISNYMNKVKQMPLHVVDKPGLKIGEIKAIARSWVKNHGIKKLVIDHMHLVYDDVEQNSAEQRFTNVANKTKELAKELDIPVISLAQLNRKENTNRQRPHEISDIKYASGIEQAADMILLIYRPEHHGIDSFPDGGSTKGYARIIFGKLRLLDKENIKCRFHGTHFSDWDEFQPSFRMNSDTVASQRDRVLGENNNLPF